MGDELGGTHGSGAGVGAPASPATASGRGPEGTPLSPQRGADGAVLAGLHPTAPSAWGQGDQPDPTGYAESGLDPPRLPRGLGRVSWSPLLWAPPVLSHSGCKRTGPVSPRAAGAPSHTREVHTTPWETRAAHAERGGSGGGGCLWGVHRGRLAGVRTGSGRRHAKPASEGEAQAAPWRCTVGPQTRDAKRGGGRRTPARVHAGGGGAQGGAGNAARLSTAGAPRLTAAQLEG